jgi:hypothetical protein
MPTEFHLSAFDRGTVATRLLVIHLEFASLERDNHPAVGLGLPDGPTWDH